MIDGLVMPRCVPEELVSGTIGRAVVLNGRPRKQILAAIAGESGATIRSGTIIGALADAFGLERDPLIRRHTNAPFLARFGSTQRSGTEQARLLSHAAHSLTSPTGAHRFCSHCVAEDLAWYGFAFWRRAHQLPGMDACLKHLTPLVRTRCSPMDGPPDHAPRNSCEYGQPESFNDPQSIHMRYMRTAQELLTISGWPIDGTAIVRRLRETAMSLGLRVRPDRQGRRPTLGTYARARADAGTIHHLMYVITGSRADCVWRSLDVSLTHKKLSSARICLIASMLYDDVDSTLRVLTEVPDTPPACADANHAVPDSILMRTYYQTRGNHQLTASRLGRSQWTISSALRRRNLPDLSADISLVTLRALRAFLSSGQSLNSACDAYGADVADVERLLRSTGAPLVKLCEKIIDDRTPAQPAESDGANGRAASVFPSDPSRAVKKVRE
ncbi:TniQ family protein [Salinisphaera hydrothermalis]|uniref:TniQ family protein n=1 Tax=Salinisphaera hydrothermalis TaxID=563188 RepID=UPI00333F3A7C